MYSTVLNTVVLLSLSRAPVGLPPVELGSTTSFTQPVLPTCSFSDRHFYEPLSGHRADRACFQIKFWIFTAPGGDKSTLAWLPHFALLASNANHEHHTSHGMPRRRYQRCALGGQYATHSLESVVSAGQPSTKDGLAGSTGLYAAMASILGAIVVQHAPTQFVGFSGGIEQPSKTMFYTNSSEFSPLFPGPVLPYL
jgi:hypothetical protein